LLHTWRMAEKPSSNTSKDRVEQSLDDLEQTLGVDSDQETGFSESLFPQSSVITDITIGEYSANSSNRQSPPPQSQSSASQSNSPSPTPLSTMANADTFQRSMEYVLSAPGLQFLGGVDEDADKYLTHITSYLKHSKFTPVERIELFQISLFETAKEWFDDKHATVYAK